MKTRMRRTQIYLDPDLAEALDRLAQRRGTSRAEVVRSAARRLVADDAAERDRDPIWGIAGIGQGPSDGRGSLDHDRILNELVVEEMREFQEHRES